MKFCTFKSNFRSLQWIRRELQTIEMSRRKVQEKHRFKLINASIDTVALASIDNVVHLSICAVVARWADLERVWQMRWNPVRVKKWLGWARCTKLKTLDPGVQKIWGIGTCYFRRRQFRSYQKIGCAFLVAVRSTSMSLWNLLEKPRIAYIECSKTAKHVKGINDAVS